MKAVVHTHMEWNSESTASQTTGIISHGSQPNKSLDGSIQKKNTKETMAGAFMASHGAACSSDLPAHAASQGVNGQLSGFVTRI